LDHSANITDPNAIKSEKAIPIGDKLKDYYSATDLITRGTPTGIKYHLTFVTEQDIESIKQIPTILEYIKASKLSVPEDVIDGEKAIPIGCLLNIHSIALKTNIYDLEKDLEYNLNADRMSYNDPSELKIKLNPRQLLSRRLNQPPLSDSSVIEILATERDKSEILTLIPGICYGHDYFGSFFDYGNPDQNPVKALQEHNTFLKKHRVVALRAKREVLRMETSRGFSMESEILKVKNHQGGQSYACISTRTTNRKPSSTQTPRSNPSTPERLDTTRRNTNRSKTSSQSTCTRTTSSTPHDVCPPPTRCPRAETDDSRDPRT
jgi:hypothetical protein